MHVNRYTHILHTRHNRVVLFDVIIHPLVFKVPTHPELKEEARCRSSFCVCVFHLDEVRRERNCLLRYVMIPEITQMSTQWDK